MLLILQKLRGNSNGNGWFWQCGWLLQPWKHQRSQFWLPYKLKRGFQASVGFCRYIRFLHSQSSSFLGCCCFWQVEKCLLKHLLSRLAATRKRQTGRNFTKNILWLGLMCTVHSKPYIFFQLSHSIFPL